MTIEFRKPIQSRPLRTCLRGRGFAEPRSPLPKDRTTVDIIGSVEHRRTIGCVAKGSHHAGFPAVRISNYGTTFEEFKSAYRSSERRTKRRTDSQGKVSNATTTTFRSNASQHSPRVDRERSRSENSQARHRETRLQPAIIQP